ncbi:hypothetical protein [Pedobacter soli]|uniref:Uncharacterized protein n=1 Tax=Pedobacter soli TaxID=390242 RepID=A0A1G6JXX0_9SPHI|nr:hypothetical protein [Pedobacter soli]SDC23612.1 hypothetical protein SAMN04488024_101592 [Pedobacter soli]
MDLTALIRISRENIEEYTPLLREVEINAEENFSDMELGAGLVNEVVELFHNAFGKDPGRFVREVFLEGAALIKLTGDHQHYIYQQFEELKKAAPDRNFQIRLVNLYRSTVSDMYDPYLSIIVGCLQFIEGIFTSINQANLSGSEHNKLEFIQSRMKNSKLFEGYFSIIRNAVSHAGTHGISYAEGHIVFRNIKRSSNPFVSATAKISNHELLAEIQAMINFTTAIDVARNVFGLDIGNMIVADKKIASHFANHLADREAFELWRARCDQYHEKIWVDGALSEEEKIDKIAKLFTAACTDNGLEAISVTLKKDPKILVINIPYQEIDHSDENLVVARIVKMIKYCIIAEPVFCFRYSSFLVQEEEKEGKDSLQVWLQGNDLKEYWIRNADIHDLIVDGKIYKNKEYLNVTVDFQTLEELEMKSLVNKNRRRKPRV